VGLGTWMTVACIVCSVNFVWQRFRPRNDLLHLCAQNANYYLFMWPWVFNITIAISMAYVRFYTLGFTWENWAESFSMSFFMTFYFVTVAQVINIQMLFFDQTSPLNTDWDEYWVARTLHAGQAMFAIAITMVCVIVLDESTRKLCGFQTWSDIMDFAAFSFMWLPYVFTGLFWTGPSPSHKLVCQSTAYFITSLTLAINITYNKNKSVTAYVAAVITAIYVALMFWRLAVEKDVRASEEGFVTMPLKHDQIAAKE